VSFRRARRVLLIGLGAVAGAVLPARAQVPVSRDTIPGRRDTVPGKVDTARARQVRAPQGADTIRVPTPPRADSMVRNDSIRLGVVPLPKQQPRDSIKPPLARAEGPAIIEIGPARIYDRAALFATGSLTLGDFLGRVPGLTEFTTGWLGAPTVVASAGDLKRIRIFLDGLELDPLDRRAQGTSPANELPIHALEEVRVERGADEVRVYARSWRVERTDPYTRADIGTGDQNTNLYRAFFGRRYAHGEALQISAEQFNTQPDHRLASTGGLHLMGRVGTTHGPWSADLFAERSDIDQAQWAGIGNFILATDTIPGWETRRVTAYARIGNGDAERGRWFQMLASVQSFRGSPHTPTRLIAADGSDSLVTADSSSYENQYLFTGGATVLGARVSAADRVRVAGGDVSNTPSARASFDRQWLAVSLLAEGKSAIDPSRLQATARIEPLTWLALLGSASRRGGGRFERVIGITDPTGLFFSSAGTTQAEGGVVPPGITPITYSSYELSPQTSYRAEAGVRFHELWFIGGLLHRGPTTLLPPAQMDTAYARAGSVRVEDAATATTAAIRGRVYGPLHADAWAVVWSDSTGLYRPRYQTRSELYLQTNLLQRFPRGNFGLLTSLAHEYRSNVQFAQADGSLRNVEGFRTLAFKLEIRIQTAIVSYQFRNLLQSRYAEVPGFIMPRQTQFYGVRWDFWN